MAKFSITLNKIDNSFSAELSNNSKFYADAFIQEDEKYFLLMNGVNLSYTSIEKAENFRKTINLYKKKGDDFFNVFRGSFCGALLDKEKNKWIIFNNHIGDQKIFYATTSKNILINSDVFNLSQELKPECKQDLNINASYQLLSLGYFIEDETLSIQIKRLTAGKYIIYENNHFSINSYYSIDNTPNNKLTEKECLNKIDTLFRNAINLEYKKDLMYGYNHIASMSGGLDCRMNNWVAREMGYNNITNITFAQYGSLDMILAHQMSSFLKNEWIFKALDNGSFLKNIDEQVYITNATVNGIGSSHALSALKLIDFLNFGVLHSGQVGDVIISSFLSPSNSYSKFDIKKIKTLSKKLTYKINLEQVSSYKNNEIANMYIRAFNGALTGNLTTQVFTEVASPFLDIDFLNFCMSIPVELRAYHNLYKKWIIKKYPKAAQFKWENINAKITTPTLPIRGKTVPLNHLLKFIIEGIFYNIGKPINNTYNKKTMNPYNYWLKSNIVLQQNIENYFKEHIDLISHKELKKDCEDLFTNGQANEKMAVLTLLSAIKQLGL